MNTKMEVVVDVHGANVNQAEFLVNANGQCFRFIIDEQLKRGKNFNFAVFFSKAIFSKVAYRYPKSRRIGVLSESPIDNSHKNVSKFIGKYSMILTHQKSLFSRGSPFFPLYFGTNWIAVTDEARTEEIKNRHPDKKHLVSFIGSLEHPDTGAYRLRRKVAEYLIKSDGIDCFGKGIRELTGKYEAIAPYMFSVAMENAASDYYFTEKLVDCLLLETVPIYFGCPSIEDCFDTKGFLTFSSLEEFRVLESAISQDIYDKMKPFVLKNKKVVIERLWHNHAGLFHRIARVVSGNSDLTSLSSYKYSGLYSQCIGAYRKFVAD